MIRSHAWNLQQEASFGSKARRDTKESGVERLPRENRRKARKKSKEHAEKATVPRGISKSGERPTPNLAESALSRVTRFFSSIRKNKNGGGGGDREENEGRRDRRRGKTKSPEKRKKKTGSLVSRGARDNQERRKKFLSGRWQSGNIEHAKKGECRVQRRILEKT